MFRLLTLWLACITPVFAQTKTVYLTFDDGPQKGTAEVLDILKEEGVTAAFFLTGSNAITIGGIAPQTQLVLREIAEGHTLANHCYIHKPMTKADYTATYGDLETEAQKTAFHTNYERNVEHFRKTLEKPDLTLAFARLPGDGSTFPKLVAETERLGMKHFHWQFEIATNGVFKWLKQTDWQGIPGVATEDVGLPPDGAVILFHDRHWAGTNREILKNLIQFLKSKGYAFGKLADWKPAPPRAPKPAPAAAKPAEPKLQ